MNQVDELISPATLARELDVSVHTLTDWRYRKVGPQWIPLPSGKRNLVRYRRSDVRAWLQPAAPRGAA